MRHRLLVAAAALGGFGSAAGQSGVILETRTVLAPSFATWRFSAPLDQDTLPVDRASQLALPVSASMIVGAWTLDIAGAYAVSTVRLASGRDITLSGPTDVRVRAVGRLIGDQLLVTGSVNLPVGKTKLSGEEIDALRVVAAPGLGFAVPQLGLGSSGSAGMVFAWEAGPWGLALGASYEIRGRYSPVDAQIAGIDVLTDLDPGSGIRFSVGADRLVGTGRFSMLAAAEVFGTDRLTVSRAGESPLAASYQLGPQFSLDLALDLAARGFERITIGLGDRYRMAFTGADGENTPGSTGNMFVAFAEAVTGSGQGLGGFGRVEGRFDSGIDSDPTLTTAAATIGGVTLGLVARAGRVAIQPFGRFSVGRLDTGLGSTSVTGFGGGLTVTIR